MQAGLHAHDNFIWYQCLLLLLHSLEQFLKTDLDHLRSAITATLKVISAIIFT